MSKPKRRKASTPSRSTAQASRGGPTSGARKLPIIPIVIVGAVAVLVVAIVLSFGSSEDAPLEYGEPTVTGTALPRFSGESTGDPGIGATIPEVAGADWEGTAASITNNGSPKLLVFLAHWCPVCQEEVPVVVDWLEEGRLPGGVEIVAVATGIDRFRDNYPPSAWFTREGWTPPVIMDDETNSVAGAFGLNAYPYWVFVNGDGTVAARVSGLLEADALSALAESLAP